MDGTAGFAGGAAVGSAARNLALERLSLSLPAKSTRLRAPRRLTSASRLEPVQYSMKTEWDLLLVSFIAVASTALALSARFTSDSASSTEDMPTRVAPTTAVPSAVCCTARPPPACGALPLPASRSRIVSL